jgi:hypothetical protein
MIHQGACRAVPEGDGRTAGHETGPAPTAALDIDALTRELAIDWGEADRCALLARFSPYLAWIETLLAAGEEIPSHIPGSASIAVPIGESTTPAELFAALGPGVSFTVREYEEFWLTIHYPNPEPVVTLLPKVLPGVPHELEELCARCSAALGVPVGGPGGWFLAWLLPGFSWAMHTDHDNRYEQVAARVQVPLLTNPDCHFIWGRIHEGRREEWLVRKHLAAGKAHYVRVDVPHTVVNSHPTASRLHLILDVHEPVPCTR